MVALPEAEVGQEAGVGQGLPNCESFTARYFIYILWGAVYELSRQKYIKTKNMSEMHLGGKGFAIISFMLHVTRCMFEYIKAHLLLVKFSISWVAY